MSTTGTLEVLAYSKKTRYQWNGIPEDRAAARAAFEDAMGDGISFVSVVDAPGKSRQVHTWREIEQIEKERGTVVVRQSAPLVGG